MDVDSSIITLKSIGNVDFSQLSLQLPVVCLSVHDCLLKSDNLLITLLELLAELLCSHVYCQGEPECNGLGSVIKVGHEVEDGLGGAQREQWVLAMLVRGDGERE